MSFDGFNWIFFCGQKKTFYNFILVINVKY